MDDESGDDDRDELTMLRLCLRF